MGLHEAPVLVEEVGAGQAARGEPGRLEVREVRLAGPGRGPSPHTLEAWRADVRPRQSDMLVSGLSLRHRPGQKNRAAPMEATDRWQS